MIITIVIIITINIIIVITILLLLGLLLLLWLVYTLYYSTAQQIQLGSPSRCASRSSSSWVVISGVISPLM